MNGEQMVLKTEPVIFPLKHADEVSELEIIEEKEVITSVTENKIVVKETRFARLKKSLRKRSASIL